MSFLTVFMGLGFSVLIGGMAWALITAGVPLLYVAITSVNLFALAFLIGATRSGIKIDS